MKKVIDVTVRLTYDADVPVEDVRAAVEFDLEAVRQKGGLRNVGWQNNPELGEVTCESVALAKPQVVIDLTDLTAWAVSGSQELEVVAISRDATDVQEIQEGDASAEHNDWPEKDGLLTLATWPGDGTNPDEPCAAQRVDATVDASVAKLLEELNGCTG